MKLIFHLLFLALYITATHSSLYSDLKSSLASYLKKAQEWTDPTRTANRLSDDDDQGSDSKLSDDKGSDIEISDDKGSNIKISDDKGSDNKISDNKRSDDNADNSEKRYVVKKQLSDQSDDYTINFKVNDEKTDKEFQVIEDPKPTKMVINSRFTLDPVLNFVETRRKRRRQKKVRSESDSSMSSSTSLELPKWKDEWREHWIHKKLEAVNDTIPRGDVINMVAARPWGVSCGDPNQHDMPWGTCMLAMECDAEYRIYRGDFMCGKTQFICCALQMNAFDMYQAIDVSFEESGLSTSSDEIRERNRGSNERRKRKKARQRRKRRRNRLRRKKKIRRNIRKIVREMRKLLKKMYRNGTRERKRKTNQLKKFIKALKRKFRKDRKSVIDIHELEMIKVDDRLMARIKQVKAMNHNFMFNETFRNIVVNGTINKVGARMLAEAYPELKSSFTGTLKLRRSGADGDGGTAPKDYLDYDIEYGMLYY